MSTGSFSFDDAILDARVLPQWHGRGSSSGLQHRLATQRQPLTGPALGQITPDPNIPHPLLAWHSCDVRCAAESRGCANAASSGPAASRTERLDELKLADRHALGLRARIVRDRGVGSGGVRVLQREQVPMKPHLLVDERVDLHHVRVVEQQHLRTRGNVAAATRRRHVAAVAWRRALGGGLRATAPRRTAARRPARAACATRRPRGRPSRWCGGRLALAEVALPLHSWGNGAPGLPGLRSRFWLLGVFAATAGHEGSPPGPCRAGLPHHRLCSRACATQCFGPIGSRDCKMSKPTHLPTGTSATSTPPSLSTWSWKS